MRPRLRLLCLALGLLLSAPSAWAWGPLGHKVIARMAQDRLTPDARAAIERLRASGSAAPFRVHERDPAYRFIGRDLVRFFRDRRLDLGLVGSWADGWRSREPATGAWHFVDLPVDSPLDLAAVRRACPQGNCVSGQVRAWAAVLAQPERPASERLRALFFLVHLVGDLHQPLHCATRQDKGGNQTRVDFSGREANLHEVWDSGLLDRGHIGAIRLQRQLEAGITARDAYAWERGTPEDWALESAVLAREVAYGALPGGPAPLRLGRDYQARALPVARRQLQKAAVRLAWILDRCLQGTADRADPFKQGPEGSGR